MKLISALFILALLPFSAQARDAVTITDAWMTPSLTEDTPGAVFFTLVNDSDKPVTVTGAHSPLAAHAELHRMRSGKDGMMSMERLMQAEIPAKSRLQFKPDDLHVMLFSLRHKLQAGDTLPLTLELARHAPISTQVEVRPLAARLKPSEEK